MGAATVIIALSQIVSQVGVGPAIVQRRDLERTHIRAAVTISCVLGPRWESPCGWRAGTERVLPDSRVGAGAPRHRPPVPDRRPEYGRRVAAHAAAPVPALRRARSRQLCHRLRLRGRRSSPGSAMACGPSSPRISRRSPCAPSACTWPPVIRCGPSFNRQASRDLLSFGLGHSLAQVGTVLSQQGDNLVVGRWLGPAALGIYGRAYSLMVMPATVFGKIVNRVLFPVMAQVQDEPERLAGAYERALAIVAWSRCRSVLSSG